MAKPEVYSNGEKAKAVQKKIDDLAEKLEELNMQWMEAAEKLEKYNQTSGSDWSGAKRCHDEGMVMERQRNRGSSGGKAAPPV